MKDKIFQEKIEIDENTITIHVNCELRKYAVIEKRIYRDSQIMNLIPEEFRGKIKITKEPEKRVSNINMPHFTTSGTWVFKIIKEEESIPSSKTSDTQTSTSRNTRKKPARPTRRKTTTTKK